MNDYKIVKALDNVTIMRLDDKKKNNQKSYKKGLRVVIDNQEGKNLILVTN